ncbi:cornifelin homolog A-like [Gigantopelta aegis]|uniref:cornifelin homolog A-like n=1 Tax=Gigantopelta aegis TaxID=1735272 RepID=UPI001B88860F|nr:cornifelin homolog A-like [Gigantopelta aegis]
MNDQENVSPIVTTKATLQSEVEKDFDGQSSTTGTADYSSVVTSQPRPQKLTRVELLMPFDEAHSEREWSAGLFECKSGRRHCCSLCCCWCYFRYMISTRLGETPFMPHIPCAVFALRVKVRTLFSIKGSLIKDFYTSLCCEPCAVCQMTRELDSVGL